jgi:hypothetical protein
MLNGYTVCTAARYSWHLNVNSVKFVSGLLQEHVKHLFTKILAEEFFPETYAVIILFWFGLQSSFAQTRSGGSANCKKRANV